jgi:uncharacterized protein YjbI with pentapeptide repeats
MAPYSVEPAAQHSFLSGHLHLCVASMRVPKPSIIGGGIWQLGGANLSGANLSCANLGEANLRDANLGGVNLGDAQLIGGRRRAVAH